MPIEFVPRPEDLRVIIARIREGGTTHILKHPNPAAENDKWWVALGQHMLREADILERCANELEATNKQWMAERNALEEREAPTLG